MPILLAAVDSFSMNDAFAVSALGVLVGFAALSALMLLVCLLRFIVGKLESRKTVSIDTVSDNKTYESFEVKISTELVPAKGSMGEVMLHDVDDKTAAMLMAIVADEMKAPLNELRFISISEVK